jgi:uncharacterized ferritin-like protein (DUF455 family)
MSIPPEPKAADTGHGLRQQALSLLLLSQPEHKARAVAALDAPAHAVLCDVLIHPGATVPGRPQRPHLVQPGALSHRAVGTPQGRASLIHALAHIEANAINLALDIVWRFPHMPETFYRDWFAVAQEEALHFQLLSDHLQTAGHQYGDFPAHDGLWDMAERTRDDVLARLALVPRTLEARGLDATPAIRKKLVSVGDRRGGADSGHHPAVTRLAMWPQATAGIGTCACSAGLTRLPPMTCSRCAIQHPCSKGPLIWMPGARRDLTRPSSPHCVVHLQPLPEPSFRPKPMTTQVDPDGNSPHTAQSFMSIARQPILDAKRAVFGYELFDRTSWWLKRWKPPSSSR